MPNNASHKSVVRFKGHRKLLAKISASTITPIARETAPPPISVQLLTVNEADQFTVLPEAEWPTKKEIIAHFTVLMNGIGHPGTLRSIQINRMFKGIRAGFELAGTVEVVARR